MSNIQNANPLSRSYSPPKRGTACCNTPAWQYRGHSDPNSSNDTNSERSRPRYDPTRKYRPVDGQSPIFVPVKNGDITKDWRKPVETPVTTVPATNIPDTKEHQLKKLISATISIVPAVQEQQNGNGTSTNTTRPEEQSKSSSAIKTVEKYNVRDCTTNSQNDGKPAEGRHRAKKTSTKVTKERPQMQIKVGDKIIVCNWADPSEPKYTRSSIIPPDPSTLPIPSFFKPRVAPKQVDNASNTSNESTGTPSDNKTDLTSVSNAAVDEFIGFISDNEEKYAASVEDNATDSSSVTNPYDSYNESTWSVSDNGGVSLWLENERTNSSLAINPVENKAATLTWTNSADAKDHSASSTSNNTIDSNSISRIGCPVENENVIRAIQIDNKPVRMRILEEMEGEKWGYWIVRNFPWIRDNPRYSPREDWEVILNNLLWAKYYPDQYAMYQQKLYMQYQQTLLNSVD
jgi:hypothetical protein